MKTEGGAGIIANLPDEVLRVLYSEDGWIVIQRIKVKTGVVHEVRMSPEAFDRMVEIVDR